MTKKVLAIICVFTWAMMAATACGGGNKEVKSDEPEVLLPGEVVESVDANIDSVRCQGKGVDQPTAMTQARKACLEWYITTKLAQTQEERNAYRAKQAEIFRNLDRYVKIPEIGPRSELGEGVKSSRRIDDDTIAITIITKVFRDQLQGDLLSMGIVKSKDEVQDAVGNPTMMVVPAAASKGNQYRDMVEQAMGSYLTSNTFDVQDAAAVANRDKLVDAIGEVAGAEEDEAAKIALAVGADVYVTFNIKQVKNENNNEVAFSVTVNATETATGRALAKQTKVGPAASTWQTEGAMKAIVSVATDAMGEALPQITRYWRDDQPKGRNFYVVFKNTPKNADMAMSGVFKKSCSKVKLEPSTAKTATFKVQCKMDVLELSAAIDEGITAKLGGAEYEFAVKNPASVVVVFK
jgi:hypothetical protein